MSSPATTFSHKTFNQQLKKYYAIYTGGFIAFVIALAIAEQLGMSRQWIGYWFLFATIVLYAVIGIMSRTVDAAEYYVAGRRVHGGHRCAEGGPLEGLQSFGADPFGKFGQAVQHLSC